MVDIPSMLAEAMEHHRAGRLGEAEQICRRVVEADAEHADAHHGLAKTLKAQGRLEEAASSFKRVLELAPHVAEVHNSLGIALQEQGDISAAAACYRRAVELKPALVSAHNNLGSCLQAQGDLVGAVAAYQQAIALDPTVFQAHVNLGNALQDQGKLDEAESSYQAAVATRPDSIEACSQLWHQRRRLCVWRGLDELSAQVIEGVEQGGGSVPPFLFLNLPTTPAQQLRCGQQRADRSLQSVARQRQKLNFMFPAVSREKIRLGYLSHYFREHAIAWLAAELFECHDRSQFEVFGYSYGPDDRSPTRERVAAAFDRFVDIRSLSFVDAAAQINHDQIDILIDLTGYMQGGRDAIPALRPAPVQVNYLTYPGTMGAGLMDYIVVDDFVVPPGQQAFFGEQLVYLPGSYLVNDTKRQIAERTPSRAACNLPPDGFVFCSFNQPHKITPEMFEIWMRLLAAVEGSVLWLWESNRWAGANLRREAEARGVDGARLVFAPSLPPAEHLARYRRADLVLDTLPYNGHTTTADALWAGCPVVACAGQTFAARVAGSLLRAVGLEELITHTLEDYECLALELATSPGRLRDLRKNLAANRDASALFDCQRSTRNLESAFSQMWQIYLAGESPRPFVVADA
ncbi:MAG: tetratricopeptide repeat protein [Phycisphaerae bacterium]|nr:tetratricopeptide repeat protein [Phycisphaerae bacterium]